MGWITQWLPVLFTPSEAAGIGHGWKTGHWAGWTIELTQYDCSYVQATGLQMTIYIHTGSETLRESKADVAVMLED